MDIRISLYWGGDLVYTEVCRRTATTHLSVDDRIRRAIRDVERRVKFPYDTVVVSDQSGHVLRRDRLTAA